MRLGALGLVCMFIVFSCGKPGEPNKKWLPKNKAQTIVFLQPLPFVPAGLMRMLRDSIPIYYPVTVQIATAINMPASAYYAPRNRYKADSLLGFLQHIKPPAVRIIAGITESDISTRKGNIDDYGIMGLGLTPGDVCVVSTYRLQKDKPSEKLLAQRLLKTVVHELGHNFGLPHCPNKHCIMADAEGRLNQDNETGLCPGCRKALGLY